RRAEPRPGDRRRALPRRAEALLARGRRPDPSDRFHATGPLIASRRVRRRYCRRTSFLFTPSAARSCSLAAADPRAREVALEAHLQRSEDTGRVGERHLLATGGGMRGRILPVEQRARSRRVVLALLERRRRPVDRPERGDRVVGGVLQTDEVTGRRRGLEL